MSKVLNLLFGLRGRIGSFGYFLLGKVLPTILLAVGSIFLALAPEYGGSDLDGMVGVVLVSLALWMLLFSAPVRRLHDFGWSGIWALTILFSVFLFKSGDPGANGYGPRPRI